MADLGNPSQGDVPPVLRKAIYYTLRVGVGAAVLLLVVGTAFVLSGPSGVFGTLTTSGVAFSFRGLSSGSVTGRGTDLLLLGFLVLILTPLARVVISAIAFGTVRDRAFTALTLAVLALLGVSMLLGAFP